MEGELAFELCDPLGLLGDLFAELFILLLQSRNLFRLVGQRLLITRSSVRRPLWPPPRHPGYDSDSRGFGPAPVNWYRQSARDVLTEVLRTGARQLLATAIEAEVDEYVAARAKTVDATGRRGVVRNGHLPKRALQTPLGDVTVQQPRVRDRRPDDERETFRSAILPPSLRKTPSVEALYPWLSLKGLSTGDFGEALQALLGLNQVRFYVNKAEKPVVQVVR